MRRGNQDGIVDRARVSFRVVPVELMLERIYANVWLILRVPSAAISSDWTMREAVLVDDYAL